MNITTKKFFSYTLLPRIIPMVRDLMKPGFGLIALSMAQIYAGCGLLPRNHAYLNRQNMGRFGITNVIIEAGRNLKFTRDRLDQVLIYGLLLLAIVLLFGQFLICGFVIFTQAAHAVPLSYVDYFVTDRPKQDIAYILLDRVFGIPDLFGSCASLREVCLSKTPGVLPEPWPLPYHAALQDMLSFYSVGLCVIALIIFLYYVVAVLLETAESGTPFGRRFNHVWAPIRMVLALALLIPVSYGLNGAQLLTLHVAKWGSSFATNGWLAFSDSLQGSGNMIAPEENLVGFVQKAGGGSLFQFFTVVSACKKLYATEGITIDAYLVRTSQNPPAVLLKNTDYNAALDFYDRDDIIVAFGERDAEQWKQDKGNVHPFCGELTLSSVDQTDKGAISIQSDYYTQIIQRFWSNASTGSPEIGNPNRVLENGKKQGFFFDAADRAIEYAAGQIDDDGNWTQFADAEQPDEWATSDLILAFADDMAQYLDRSRQEAIADDWKTDLSEYGWAGAGMWYNKLAQKNGGLMAAVSNLPQVRKWPLVMEAVAEEVGKSSKDRSEDSKFLPATSEGKTITLPPGPGMSMRIANALNAAYQLWSSQTPKETDAQGYSVPPHITQNAMTDFLRELFGTTGLFNMAENTDIHPLAQIVIMGKYLLETSIRNLGAGVVGGFIAKWAGGVPGEGMKVITGFLSKIGMMTLAVGFVLYYVVPFMPFLYFFFQVGGWIKGLFEAMIGLPLWALAHIRIDGEGLAGPSAIGGYWLILELFLRPILTIFGLIGSIAIFAAQVKVLNEIFALVVTNVTGFDQSAAAVLGSGVTGGYSYYRGYVDQLFYTIIYAIIVYMIGTSSFKLIYMIPDRTLRWMGGSVESFGDEIAKQNPEHLVGHMFGGVSIIGRKLGGGG